MQLNFDNVQLGQFNIQLKYPSSVNSIINSNLILLFTIHSLVHSSHLGSILSSLGYFSRLEPFLNSGDGH